MTETKTKHPTLDKLSERKASYRTRPAEVSVEFAGREQIIETLEGPVLCRPGDAIVTGSRGERWPQPVSGFIKKYEPAQGQESNANGRFTKRIKTKDAAQIHEPLFVELSNGRGSLRGSPGDWCVWNDSTDMFIVARDIFPELYEPETVTVYVELGKDLTDEEKYSALQVIHSLDVSLYQTTIVYSEESSNAPNGYPIWFRIGQSEIKNWRIVPSQIEIPIDAFISSDPRRALLKQLKTTTSPKGPLTFSLRKFFRMLGLGGVEDRQDSLSQVICSQLAAVDDFNAGIKARWNGNFSYFVQKRDALSEPNGLKKAWRIGAIADQLAGENQDKWQRLVFATTKEIAGQSMLKRLLSVPHTLVTLGILAAVMLAAFSELGGNCDRNDPWGFELCASSVWAQWARPSFFGIYLIALGVAWFQYVNAKTQQWEVRHQDYRLLAESIRVLHTRTVLGNPSCVASDLPLAEPTDSGWVRLALRSVYFDVAKAGLQTSDEAPIQVERALTTFVKDQMRYHEETLLDRREKAIERLSRTSRLGFRLFMIVLIVVGANVASEVLLHRAFLSAMMDHVALILMVIGLASWGGMRKVLDTFVLEQEVQRGNLVLSYLSKADELGTRDAILESANYFLEDQAHWHALHRSKPIEATTGG